MIRINGSLPTRVRFTSIFQGLKDQTWALSFVHSLSDSLMNW